VEIVILMVVPEPKHALKNHDYVDIAALSCINSFFHDISL